MYSLFVGIDVSKDSFSVAALSEKAKTVFSMCPLMDAEGFAEFLKVVASMKNDIRRILQTTFPELEQLVDVLSGTMLRFLKVFPSAGLINQTTPEIVAEGKYEGMSMISRRGNRHLRKVIYNMTFCVVRYVGPFRDYFFRRKREGLPFRKAMLATAHKLIRTIFAMLNSGTLYKLVEVA